VAFNALSYDDDVPALFSAIGYRYEHKKEKEMRREKTQKQ
jgi:hypothetical protein